MSTDLGEHFRAIWKRKYHVLALSLLIAGGVYLLSSQRAEVFEASVRLRLVPAEVASGQRASETETAFLTTSYAELASSDAVLTRAATALGTDVDAIESDTDVEPADTPGFIDVSASAGSPEEAADIATALSTALVAAVEERQQQTLAAATEPLQAELERIGDQLANLPIDVVDRPILQARYDALLQALITRQVQAVDQVDVVSPARTEDAPVSPRPQRDALFAFLVALVVNGELVVLFSSMGGRLSRENLAEDVTATTGLPLLATVPTGSRAETSEAFRELRTNLQFMAGIQEISSLAIVGDGPEIGKTTTALNLARSMASLGTAVVVVDGDLRRPSLHEHLACHRAPGVTDFLAGDRNVVRTAPSGEPAMMRVMTSGRPLADPSDLLTVRVGALIEHLGAAELVIIDTPPLRLFADALNIAAQCDATVMVVDVRSTKRQALKSAVERLNQVGANVVGVVANRTDAEPNRRYYDVAAAEADPSRARDTDGARGRSRTSR